MRVFESGSAAERLAEARAFIESFPPSAEILLVGASREAVDDLARLVSLSRGFSFGLHRFSLIQLAARLAAPRLASAGLSPTTALGIEAIGARAAFEAARASALDYFGPVVRSPGFPRALARTVTELRLCGSHVDGLIDLPAGGPDLRDLVKRCEEELAKGGIADRAALFRAACAALEEGSARFAGLPLLLFDVALDTVVARTFVARLVPAAPQALATIPFGDGSAHLACEAMASEFSESRIPNPALRQAQGALRLSKGESREHSTLTRLRTFLFADQPATLGTVGDDLVLFSAPGEGRECVEIARRILEEAHQGVPFDRIAVLVRSVEHYAGLLEHAFTRAGIRAYFDRGTRRPEPSGRAFLALLGCAVEGLSARRFAEYLSLGQVPALDRNAVPPNRPAEWEPPSDEIFGAADRPVATRAIPSLDAGGSGQEPGASHVEPDAAELAGSLRAPWKWERLLGEAAVIGGRDRWMRRLNGLAAEYEIKRRALEDEEPESPRLAAVEDDLRNLAHLRAFGLPIIEVLGSWPAEATWGEWLRRFEALAPRVLRYPARVVQVLVDLRPMAEVGPVPLREARDVLADRLGRLQEEPPSVRYGHVFVGTPDRARGRVFEVVFVPGLAERIFPQKPREDPMLGDELRQRLDGALPTQFDRAQHERLLLRLAIGAAGRRVYLSYPRMDVGEARPRVPSFYALDVMRAATGRVPPHEQLEQAAEREAQASLAWPAPLDPARAIDDLEHDLAVIRPFLQQDDPALVRGRAHYLLRLNDFLRESLVDRWARWSEKWSPRDGLVRAVEATRDALAPHRLRARPYSTSALQRFASCPYQFLLSAIYRIKPMEEPEPLERMDPLTRGQIFHRIQAELFRALKAAPGSTALSVLDETIDRVAAAYHELLAPAIERVWRDEIASIRMDLRAWLRMVAGSGEPWEPAYVELSFGLEIDTEHDPHSVREPVVLDDGFVLRGSIDLIERRRDSSPPVYRVTDHKTGRNRSRPGMVIGQGAVLQPVLYSLAVEKLLQAQVSDAQLFYCTSAGNFHRHAITVKDDTKRLGMEALEIIDRSIEQGILPPAPLDYACQFCDFRPVCGPNEVERVAKKKSPPLLLGDLQLLRTRP
ncbi:MAG: PD-(D/E)XK nuclease family protein [Acidobacteria bacterium]|nr:PD-(D/E)XK nuclease family protein [Acidobacteriota bacterium]